MACNTEECKDQGIHIDPPPEPHHDCDCNLIAGANITIEETSEGTVISATGGGGGGYVAGDHISISGNTISAVYDNATQSADGLMSSADKTKLDGLTAYTAGDNITITNGVISLDVTKQDLLEILGVEEIELSAFSSDNTARYIVLGYKEV